MRWWPKYQLRIQEADGKTWVFHLEAWRIKIGRPWEQEKTTRKHLKISDPYICHVQMELRWSLAPPTYVLVHKGKVNHSYLGGEPVQRVVLVPGDFIGMGRTKMFYERRGYEPEKSQRPEATRDYPKPVLSWYPDDEWLE